MGILGILFLLFVFFRLRKKMSLTAQTIDWRFRIFLSKEDAVKQLLMISAQAFMALTLFIINSDFGSPIAGKDLLIILALLGILWAYKFKVFFVLITSVLGFTLWYYIQFSELVANENIIAILILSSIGITGTLFLIIGDFHDSQTRYKRFALFYNVLAIVFVSGIFFFLSSRIGISYLENFMRGSGLDSNLKSIGFFLVPACLTLFLTYHAKQKEFISLAECLGIYVLTAFFCLLAILPGCFDNNATIIDKKLPFDQLVYSYKKSLKLSTNEVIWAIFLNLALFVQQIGIIFLGYIRKESWLINLGAVSLSLIILTKYFDWFFTFMNKSLAFLIGGLLLLGIGWFMEKGRTQLLKKL